MQVHHNNGNRGRQTRSKRGGEREKNRPAAGPAPHSPAGHALPRCRPLRSVSALPASEGGRLVRRWNLLPAGRCSLVKRSPSEVLVQQPCGAHPEGDCRRPQGQRRQAGRNKGRERNVGAAPPPQANGGGRLYLLGTTRACHSNSGHALPRRHHVEAPRRPYQPRTQGLDQGEEPDAPGDDPGDGCARLDDLVVILNPSGRGWQASCEGHARHERRPPRVPDQII